MSAIDAKRPSGHRQRIRRDRVLLLLMLPGLGYFLVFHYGALFGNILAFVDYVPFLGLGGSEWVGLANFRQMFGDPGFWNAVRNTVVIAGLQLVFFLPAPLALALLLHSLVGTVVKQLGDEAVLLTYAGWGHGSYTRSGCMSDAIDRYLIARTVPAGEPACPAV